MKVIRGPLIAPAALALPAEVITESIPTSITSCNWAKRTVATPKAKATPTCRREYSTRRFSSVFAAMVVTFVTMMALAPQAAADHETVGGGTFTVSNSDAPCTDFLADSVPYTVCVGSPINLTNQAEYIVVPLGIHASVSCDTYTPDGSLFEHAVENLADVPEKQLYWAQHGWGSYNAEALCQLW